MDISRRSFAGLLAMGLGGLEAVVNSGCAPIQIAAINRGSKDITQEMIEQYEHTYLSSLKDPKNRLRFLQQGEYVFPDKIFLAYIIAYDNITDEKLASGVIDHIKEVYSAEKLPFWLAQSRCENFTKRLKEIGLEDYDIVIYQRLFLSNDIIILPSLIIESEDKDFENFLPHERFHKKMHKLPKNKKHALYEAYTSLGDSEPLKQEIKNSGIDENEYELFLLYGQGKHLCNEFYATITYGELPKLRKLIENEMIKNYPEAFIIYDQLREETRLK